MTKHYDIGESNHGRFRVWEEPALGRQYFVGADCAEGKIRDRMQFRRTSILYRDQKPDYDAAIVVERETGRHVASWHGDIPITEWGFTIAAIGYYFNTALVLVEINGPGIEVINALAKRIRYPRLYRTRDPNVVAGSNLQWTWGWNTTSASRPRLLARVEEAINADPHCTRDHDLIRELRTMEIDENGIARAKHPNKDDRVLAYGMALMGRWESLNGLLDAEPGDQPYPEVTTPQDRRYWERILHGHDRAGSLKPLLHRRHVLPSASIPWDAE